MSMLHNFFSPFLLNKKPFHALVLGIVPDQYFKFQLLEFKKFCFCINLE